MSDLRHSQTPVQGFRAAAAGVDDPAAESIAAATSSGTAELRRLVDALAGRDEPPQGARLRIAVDVLEDLCERKGFAVGAEQEARTLRLADVVLLPDGQAVVDGMTAGCGVARLVWELLAAKPAPEGALPHLRDAVDEIPIDVDELVARVIEDGADQDLADFFDAFEAAARDYIGTRDDVLRAVGALEGGPEQHFPPPPAVFVESGAAPVLEPEVEPAPEPELEPLPEPERERLPEPGVDVTADAEDDLEMGDDEHLEGEQLDDEHHEIDASEGDPYAATAEHEPATVRFSREELRALEEREAAEAIIDEGIFDADAAPASDADVPTLSLIFQGRRYRIRSRPFVIGRGKGTTDLRIPDSTITRHHARIEYIDGRHYMIDLGSLNGIEYRGELVARKAIVDGDVFVLCGYELRCSYRD